MIVGFRGSGRNKGQQAEKKRKEKGGGGVEGMDEGALTGASGFS